MQVRVTVELVGEPEEVGLMLAQIGETMLGDELEEGDLDPADEDSPSPSNPDVRPQRTGSVGPGDDPPTGTDGKLTTFERSAWTTLVQPPNEGEPMKVRVTVELVGDPDEVGVMLAQIGETMLGDELDELDVDVDDEDSGAWWTPERAREFVGELTLPALKAIGVIASHPPRMTFREFQRRMGMTGPQLAGRMSSIGFTVARQGTPFPFVRDYYQKVYVIDENVAALMREAATTELTRRREEPSHRLGAGRPAE